MNEHGDIVKTWCMYPDSHNGEQPRCLASCDEEGCEYALIMYEDGYSRYGNDALSEEKKHGKRD